MSIYDKSSLVLIPSGTKTGKVFSQKPVSGDGDFTFTRASAATRVNADGNIEKETSNLLLQSNQFDTTWTLNVNASAASGQSGYNGSNNAWLLSTIGGQYSSARQVISSSGVHTFSVYAKAGSLGAMALSINVTGNATYQWFDLSNGTLGVNQDNNEIDATIELVNGTTDWYRCSVTHTGSLLDVRIFPTLINTFSTTAGNIYIQDAQLNQGLIAQEVITTTTTALYGGITDNTPRLDYTDSSCPALLLEPQRTNLFEQSEYFNSSYWSKIGSISITENNAVSPEGLVNASLVTTTAGSSRLQRTFSGLTAGTRTLSLFIKAGNTTNFTINIYDGILDRGCGFNISTGVVTYASSGVTASIIPFGNDGWYRVSHTYTSTATSYSCQFYFDNIGTYQVYGFQFENNASYPTSYIPTYGSSVSRVADDCAVTSVSDILNDSEGTLFLEVKGISEGGDSRRLSVSDGTTNNRVIIEIDEIAGRFKSFMSSGGVTTGTLTSSGNVQTDTNKIAVTYTASIFKMYLNGVNVVNDTTLVGTPIGLEIIRFANATNNHKMQGFVKQALIFPTAINDQEAIDLTTI